MPYTLASFLKEINTEKGKNLAAETAFVQQNTAFSIFLG